MRLLNPNAWLVPAAIWVSLFQLKSYFTWDFGFLGFVTLGAIVALLWTADAFVRTAPPLGPPKYFLPLIITLLLALSLPAAWEWWNLVRAPTMRFNYDITDNTLEAMKFFLEGKNPYAERAQLWHVPQIGPHIEVDGGDTRLFGVRYTSGYPYFPLMFLSYLPFRALDSTANFMRYGNGLLMVLCALALYKLTRVLAPARSATAAGLLALASFLGPTLLTVDMLHSALPDLAMMTYLVAGCWALSRRANLTAGVLLGLTQACKLAPAPLFVVAALWWLWRQPGFWRFLVGYLLTSAAFILPFALWAPDVFFSSTVLFYLALHASGDSTSLWSTLPVWSQPPFLLTGLLLACGLLWLSRRAVRRDVLWPLTLACTAWFVFTATSKMLHTNYLWAVYPVACAVIAARIARGNEVDFNPGLTKAIPE